MNIQELNKLKKSTLDAIISEAIKRRDPVSGLSVEPLSELIEENFSLETYIGEPEYRRGYKDGWIEATNALHDFLKAKVKPKLAQQKLFNFWNEELLLWEEKGRKDQSLGNVHEEEPPHLAP
jgi:hypothetical protein